MIKHVSVVVVSKVQTQRKSYGQSLFVFEFGAVEGYNLNQSILWGETPYVYIDLAEYEKCKVFITEDSSRYLVEDMALVQLLLTAYNKRETIKVLKRKNEIVAISLNGK